MLQNPNKGDIKARCIEESNRHTNASRVYRELIQEFGEGAVTRKTVYKWLAGYTFPTKEEALKNSLLPKKEIPKFEIIPILEKELTDSLKVNTISTNEAQKMVNTAIQKAMKLVKSIQTGFIDTILNQLEINNEYKSMLKSLSSEIKSAIRANRQNNKNHDKMIDEIKGELDSIDREEMDKYNKKRDELSHFLDMAPELPYLFQIKAVKSFGQAMKAFTEGNKAFISMAYDVDLKFNNTDYIDKDEVKDNTMTVTIKEVVE